VRRDSVRRAARIPVVEWAWCKRLPSGDRRQCHSQTSWYCGSQIPRGLLSLVCCTAPAKRVHSVFVHSFQLAWDGGWIFGQVKVDLLRACSPVGSGHAVVLRTCERIFMPVWSTISASVVTCRYIQQALICSSCGGVRSSSWMASIRKTSLRQRGGITHAK